jgi:threonine aldolase
MITNLRKKTQYMFKAEVGDDVYKQDPTVIELEAKVAAMYGSRLFCQGLMNKQP